MKAEWMNEGMKTRADKRTVVRTNSLCTDFVPDSVCLDMDFCQK